MTPQQEPSISEDVALTAVLDADPRYLSAANRRWSAVSYSLDQRPPVIRVLIGISTRWTDTFTQIHPFSRITWKSAVNVERTTAGGSKSLNTQKL
jgi:hypothetical protein